MASGGADGASTYERAPTVEQGLRMIKEGSRAIRFNKAGDDGVMQIALLLRINKTCMAINLSNNNISGKGASELALVLKNNSTLETLNLRFNNLGDKGATGIGQMLKVNKGLTSLDLWENEISAEGMKQLAIGLKDNETLRKINLVENRLGDEGATYLGQLLQYNKCLDTIYLNNNGIGDEGVKSLAKGIAKNSSLRNLFLKGNKISDTGAQEIIPYLKVNSELYSLKLENNKSDEPIKAQTVQAIGALLKSHSMPMFAFTETKIEFTKDAWELAASAAVQHKRILIAAVESLFSAQHERERVTMVMNSVNGEGKTMVEVIVSGACKHVIIVDLIRLLVEHGFDLSQTSSDGERKLNQLLAENEVVSSSSWYQSSSGYKLESQNALYESASSKVVPAYGYLSMAKVALKLMAEGEAFDREVEVRGKLREAGGDDYLKYIAEADVSPASSKRKYLIMDRGLGNMRTLLLERYFTKNQPKKARSILLALAQALAFMNDHSQMHGDFCMENAVAFDYTNRVEWKLVDFKSSVAHGEPVLNTMRKNSAPESVRAALEGASPPLASAKHDVWAFGVVLYEVLTDRHLFAGDTLSEELTTEAKLRIANWRGIGSSALALLPDNASKDLVYMCLSRDPGDRPGFKEILAHSYFTRSKHTDRTLVEPSHLYISFSTRGEPIAKDVHYIGGALFDGVSTNLNSAVKKVPGSARERIAKAAMFICALPEDALKRGKCVAELLWAVDAGVPVVAVTSENEVNLEELWQDNDGFDQLKADLEKHLTLRAFTGSLAGSAGSVDSLLAGARGQISAIFEDGSRLIAYRERKYEAEAYIREIFKLAGLLVQTSEAPEKPALENLKIVSFFDASEAASSEYIRNGITGYVDFNADEQWIEISADDGEEAQVEGVVGAVGVLLAIGSNEFFDRESERLEALSTGMKRVINVVKDVVVDTVENDYLIFRHTDQGAKEYEAEAMLQEISRNLFEACSELSYASVEEGIEKSIAHLGVRMKPHRTVHRMMATE